MTNTEKTQKDGQGETRSALRSPQGLALKVKIDTVLAAEGKVNYVKAAAARRQTLGAGYTPKLFKVAAQKVRTEPPSGVFLGAHRYVSIKDTGRSVYATKQRVAKEAAEEFDKMNPPAAVLGNQRKSGFNQLRGVLKNPPMLVRSSDSLLPYVPSEDLIDLMDNEAPMTWGHKGQARSAQVLKPRQKDEDFERVWRRIRQKHMAWGSPIPTKAKVREEYLKNRKSAYETYATFLWGREQAARTAPLVKTPKTKGKHGSRRSGTQLGGYSQQGVFNPFKGAEKAPSTVAGLCGRVYTEVLDTLVATITPVIAVNEEMLPTFAEFLDIVALATSAPGANRVACFIKLTTSRLFINLAESSISELAIKWSEIFDPPAFTTQAGEFPTGAKWYETIRRSKIVTQTVAFLVDLMCRLFGEDSIFFTAFRAETLDRLIAQGSSGLSFVDSLYDLATYWADRFSSFRASGNWMDFFERSFDARMMEELDAMLGEVNLISTHTADPRLLLESARILVVKGMHMQNPHVKDSVSKLHHAIALATSKLEKVRIPPAGFILTGPPGLGKTVMVEQLEAFYKVVKGINPSVTIVHTETATKHQELGGSVLIYNINDAFSQKEEYLDQSMLAKMQSLVDSTPYRAEAASIEAKAASLMAPHFVTISTNNSMYTFSQSNNGVNKLDRRYTIIEFIANKEKCAKVNQTPETIGAHMSRHGWIPGIVKFRVGYMDNSESVNAPDSNVVRFAISEELFVTEDAKAVLRFMHQKRVSIEKLNTQEACPQCGQFKSRCVCELAKAVLTPQGLFTIDHVHSINPDQMNEIAKRLQLSQAKLAEMIHRVGSRAVMALAALAGFVIAYRAVSSFVKVLAVTQQGMVTSVENVAQPEFVPRPFVSSIVPWLGRKETSYEWDITGVKVMHCTFVNSCVALIPRHFFDGMLPGMAFTISKGDVSCSFRYDPRCLAPAPKVGPKEVDIGFYFLHGMKGVGQFIYPGVPTESRLPVGEVSMDKRPYGKAEAIGQHLASRTLRTVAGDCGLLVVDSNGGIFGMHVGAYTEIGIACAEFLNRKMIWDALTHFNSIGLNALPEANAPLVEPQGLNEGIHPASDLSKFARFEGSLEAADHVPVGHFSAFDRDATSVIETELADAFRDLTPVMVAPPTGKAKLVDGVWASSSLSRVRHGKQSYQPRVDVVVVCVDAFVAHIPAPDVALHPYPLSVAIQGHPMNVLVNPMDVSKATGPALKFEGVTKTNCFEKTETGWIAHTVYLRQVDQLLEHLKSDEPLKMSWVKASHKNEARGLGKEARLFYVCDKAWNTALRMYLLPITAYMREMADFTKMVITMNPGSSAWASLENRLCRFGRDRILAGDYKKFDITHHTLLPHLVDFYCKMAKRCGYTDEDVWILRRLVTASLRYLLILNGDVFAMSSMWCSGRSDTIDGNCIINVIVIMYAFVRHEQESGNGLPLDELAIDFFNKIEVAVCGDDNVIGVSSATSFRGNSLAKYAMEVGGYTITSDTKAELGDELRHITEVTFLKRQFLGGLAPLDTASIGKMLVYYSGDKKSDADMRGRNISAALCAQREAFLHGPGFFKYLQMRLKKFDWVPLLDYDEIQQEFDMEQLMVWLPGLTLNSVPVVSSPAPNAKFVQQSGEIMLFSAWYFVFYVVLWYKYTPEEWDDALVLAYTWCVQRPLGRVVERHATFIFIYSVLMWALPEFVQAWICSLVGFMALAIHAYYGFMYYYRGHEWTVLNRVYPANHEQDVAIPMYMWMMATYPWWSMVVILPAVLWWNHWRIIWARDRLRWIRRGIAIERARFIQADFEVPYA